VGEQRGFPLRVREGELTMRITQLLLMMLLGLLSVPAHACGGGFGENVTIDPSQTIVISMRDGQETYIFQPRFCGAAKEFGLILPIRAALTGDPVLVTGGLYEQLATLTAPRVETVEVCSSGFGLASGSKGGVAQGDDRSNGSGVDVVDTGTVGIFSWELLKADSTQSFTDWLDARQFPYPSSAQSAFDHYVRGGWYFVAFRVTASATAPQAGYRICGDFGPISLTFPSAQAVIPALMATAADTMSTFVWRLLTVSPHRMTLPDAGATAGEVVLTPRYAANLTAKGLIDNPAVGTITTPGQWLTEMDLAFSASELTDDISLVPAPKDEAFQRVVYQRKEVDCGVFGCTIATQSIGSRWFLALLTAASGSMLRSTMKRRRPLRN
jgi:hypothetical protein